MSQQRRQTIDVCDYHHDKLCSVFDSAADISGQAQNVFLNTERNGWKTLSFELPSTYDTEDGQEKNYRLDAIKADYLLHTIEYELVAGFSPQIERERNLCLKTAKKATASVHHFRDGASYRTRAESLNLPYWLSDYALQRQKKGTTLHLSFKYGKSSSISIPASANINIYCGSQIIGSLKGSDFNMAIQKYDVTFTLDADQTPTNVRFDFSGTQPTPSGYPYASEWTYGSFFQNVLLQVYYDGIENSRLLWQAAPEDTAGYTEEPEPATWEIADSDWYIISEPKVVHTGFARNIQVNAGHVSQLLKTKNLGLEFSDENGDNGGTAGELVAKCLEGTGWSLGNVATFYENDGETVKYRTLKANAKTGTFKLIASICELFDAKPVYHGETRKVDILPLNPFSEPEPGQLPDVTKADGVIELHYGTNLSSVSRTLNTENLITKLYAYGSYGDTTSGYCGIDEVKHQEFVFTQTDGLNKGTTYWFTIADTDGKTNLTYHFTMDRDSTSQRKFIFSTYDPASMMYIWSDEHQRAYILERGEVGTKLPANVEIQLKNNNFSYIMDFDYYRECGLLTDDMIRAIAEFQRNAVSKYEAVKQKTTQMSEKLSTLDSAVGVIDFMKIAVNGVDYTEDNYLELTLNMNEYDNGIIYRTDQDTLDKDKFKLRTTSKLDTNGDPVDNPAAAYLYIVIPETASKSGQVEWMCAYLKQKIDTEDPDNTDPEHPNKLVFWMQFPLEFELEEPYDQYKFYLLKQNNVDGYLGALQVSDEAAVSSLDSTTRLITQPHPVYFETKNPRMHQEQSNTDTVYTAEMSAEELAPLNGYGWYWCSSGNAPNGTRFYFCFSDEGDRCWQKVYFTDDINTSEIKALIQQDSIGAQHLSYPWRPYWFNYKTARLYRLVSDVWVELTTTTERRITSLFNTVYRSCWTRTQYLNGLYQNYIYTHTGDELPVGNYYMESPYPTFWSFTTTKPLHAGDTLNYSTDDGWVTQTVTEEGVPTSEQIKAKGFRFDNVFYHPWNNLDGTVWEEGSICETTVSDDKAQQAGYTIDAQGMLRTRGYVAVYPDTIYTISGLLADAKIHFYNENKIWIKCIDTANSNEPCIISKSLENHTVVFKTMGSISYGSAAHKTWESKEEYLEAMHSSSTYQNADTAQRQVLDSQYEQSWNAYTMQTSDTNAQANLIDGIEPVYYIKITWSDSILHEAGHENDEVPEITMRANNYDTAVIMSGVTYERLGHSGDYATDGNNKGIRGSIDQFHILADEIYGEINPDIRQAKKELKRTEDDLAAALGDIYREGYWQDTNYIDGDEEKLYADATDNLRKIAKPDAKYEIKFLDLYSSNKDIYGDDKAFVKTNIEWPNISTASAVHLVDPEIEVNTWAFVDKLKKCWDQPKKTTLTINTNLSVIGQHTFDDVMSHIAEVASEFKGKQTKYDYYGTARVSGSNIVASTVTGTAIAPNTITGQNIVNHTITVDKIYNFEDEIVSAVKGYFGTAHINLAEIKNLAVEVANMALANIDQANIDAANIGNLNAYVANIVEANVESLIADSVIANKLEAILIEADEGEFDDLKAAIAEIAVARINTALVDKLQADDFKATVAEIAEAHITNAMVHWEKTDVSDIASLYVGNAMADKFYIQGLMVNDATIASLTVGDIVIQRPTANGIEYVKITIGDETDENGDVVLDKDGHPKQVVVYEPVNNLTGSNIAAGSITGSNVQKGTITGGGLDENGNPIGNIAQETITGANIVANSIVANNLAADDIFAKNAQIKQLIAKNIDTNTQFANKGYVGQLETYLINSTTLDLSANTSITQTVRNEIKNDTGGAIATAIAGKMKDAAPAVVEIESTNGNIFRSNTANTMLNAVVYWNGLEIRDINTLRTYFGQSAKLRWYFRKPSTDPEGQSWGDVTASENVWTPLVAQNDTTHDGFSLKVTADAVQDQVVFQCKLLVDSDTPTAEASNDPA